LKKSSRVYFILKSAFDSPIRQPGNAVIILENDSDQMGFSRYAVRGVENRSDISSHLAMQTPSHKRHCQGRHHLFIFDTNEIEVREFDGCY